MDKKMNEDKCSRLHRQMSWKALMNLMSSRYNLLSDYVLGLSFQCFGVKNRIV